MNLNIQIIGMTLQTILYQIFNHYSGEHLKGKNLNLLKNLM